MTKTMDAPPETVTPQFVATVTRGRNTGGVMAFGMSREGHLKCTVLGHHPFMSVPWSDRLVNVSTEFSGGSCIEFSGPGFRYVAKPGESVLIRVDPEAE